MGAEAVDALAVGRIIVARLRRDLEGLTSIVSRHDSASTAERHRRVFVDYLGRQYRPASVLQLHPALFEVPNYEAVCHLSALLDVDEQNATVESPKSKVIFETIFARTILSNIAHDRF